MVSLLHLSPINPSLLWSRLQTSSSSKTLQNTWSVMSHDQVSNIYYRGYTKHFIPVIGVVSGQILIPLAVTRKNFIKIALLLVKWQQFVCGQKCCGRLAEFRHRHRIPSPLASPNPFLIHLVLIHNSSGFILTCETPQEVFGRRENGAKTAREPGA